MPDDKPALLVGHAGVTFVDPNGATRSVSFDELRGEGSDVGYLLLFAQVLLLDHVARGQAQLAGAIADLAVALREAVNRPAPDPGEITQRSLAQAQTMVAELLKNGIPGLVPPRGAR